jgi:hypothetical protein
MLVTPLVVHLISKKARISYRPLFYALVTVALCSLLLIYLGLASGTSFQNVTANTVALAVFYVAYCIAASAFAAVQDPTPRIVMRLLFNAPIPLFVLASPFIGTHIERNQILYSKAYSNQMRCIVRRNDFDGDLLTYEANIYKQVSYAAFLEESVPVIPPRYAQQSKLPKDACEETIKRIKVAL